mgnify:FL=1
MCGRLGGSRALPCERVPTAMKRDSTGDHKHKDLESYLSIGMNVGPIANEYALCKSTRAPQRCTCVNLKDELAAQ